MTLDPGSGMGKIQIRDPIRNTVYRFSMAAEAVEAVSATSVNRILINNVKNDSEQCGTGSVIICTDKDLDLDPDLSINQAKQFKKP